ncbi:MAG TPA: CDP-diacylglycerol--glycerol-3-phosphate 3-phosphatidyltransferase [Pseudonocardiaceae bacterium]|nr:CDP-diacylglycerol--glycerol-3-phosphate 3-phosphatidyltransferase [Pseudonocardiaceae bacterium]
MSAESPDAARPRAAATPVAPLTAPLLNVANALTVSRLLLVPFFLLALFADGGINTGWRWVASAIFAVASITDHVDGNIARSRNLVTDFGKIADPIADKALTGGALIGLSALGQLPWWVTIVIAVREVGVTLLRFWVIRYGVIAASWGGKAKTLFQIIAIGLFVLPLPSVMDIPRWVVMGIAIALTVITGIDYVFRAVRLRVSGRSTTSTPAPDTHSDDRAA